MSRDDDDDVTLDRRFGSGVRPGVARRTSPLGVPVVTVEEDSDGKLSIVESAAIDVRLDRIERDAATSRRTASKLRGWIIGALIAAGGSLGTVGVKMFDGREADGGAKVRQQYLEQRVDQLEKFTYPWRRQDQPNQWLPNVSSQPSMSPTPKGIDP